MFVQEGSPFDGCPCSGCNLPRFVLPLLLGLLADGPQHGYQLLQRLRDFPTLRDIPPDQAGMYRLLKQMEDNGLVSGEQGPGRTVGKRNFTLTARGQAYLATWAGTLGRYQEDIACIVRFLRREQGGGGLS